MTLESSFRNCYGKPRENDEWIWLLIKDEKKLFATNVINS